MRFVTSGVAIVLGLTLWGCSANRPTGPTPTGQIVAQLGSGAAAAWSSGTPSVSWSCFSGSGDCEQPRPSPEGLGVSPVITTAPTNVQALVEGSRVSVGWNQPSGSDQPTSYVIEVGLSPGATNVAFDTASAQTFISVQGVPTGIYYVRVRGRDAAGIGPASNEITIVVTGGPAPCTGPPGVPRNVAATVIGSVVALTWLEPATGCDPESYVIQVGSSPGLTNITQVDTGTDVRSYSVVGVPAGTFYVRVSARIGSAIGSPSGDVVVSVTGNAPPGTTTWVGLVSNGDGVTINNDPDCGFLRLDLMLTLVQSGSNVGGIGIVTIRQASPTCSDAIGFRDAFALSGTVAGTLGTGSGTFTSIFNAGTEDEGRVGGSFANGRMNGSLEISDGATGTFTLNRQ